MVEETLSSMVESTRTWTHASKCEYKMEGIPRHGPSPIRSCCKGKVGPEFTDVAMWRKFSAYLSGSQFCRFLLFRG